MTGKPTCQEIYRVLKNGITTTNGDYRKYTNTSTMFFKKKAKKENLLKRLLILGDENTYLKQTSKWKSILWLWQNKPTIVDNLIGRYRDFKWYLDTRNIMDKKTFYDFLYLNKMEKDDDFVNDIFLTFDEKNHRNP